MSFSEWFNNNSPVDESLIAVTQWNLIQRHPFSITLKRGATTLAAQTVSIQHSNEEQAIAGADGSLGSRREVIIFGIVGHASVADTNIKRDDQFSYLGRPYNVTDVIVNSGSLQAWAVAIS